MKQINLDIPLGSKVKIKGFEDGKVFLVTAVLIDKQYNLTYELIDKEGTLYQYKSVYLELINEQDNILGFKLK